MNTIGYSIADASVLHLKRLAATLRERECLTLLSFGVRPRLAIRRAFMWSSYRRAALIGGAPVAMWGAAQTSRLAEEAEAWAAFGSEALKHPFAMVREAHRELRVMADAVGELYARINPDDAKAEAFAKALGFIESDRSGEAVRIMIFGGR